MNSRVPISWLAIVVALTSASGLGAQNATAPGSATIPAPGPDSLRVLVEYVGGPNLYLAVGREVGLAPNDTVEASHTGAGRSGTVRVISSVEGRCVVAFAGSPFPVTRGDSLLIILPEGARAAVAEAADTLAADTTTVEPPVPPVRQAAPAPATQTGTQRVRQSAVRPVPGPRLDGSIAFDLDARSSRAADNPDSAEPWEFSTPTARLRATATGLPGGLRLLLNGSWAQYRASGSANPGNTDYLRIYQAEVTKDFGDVPVQLRAGRFFDRHDLWGGYLDGASIRIGRTGNGPGIGVSAGRTPLGADRRLLSGSDRFSVFGDYRHRTAWFGYDMTVSYTRRTWSDAPADGYAGLTQRFRFGTVSVYQRSRVDIDPATGSAELTQMDLNTTLPLGSGWVIRGQFARRSYGWVAGSSPTSARHRERAGAGVSWSGPVGSLSLDAQVVRWGDKPRAPLYSGSLYLPRLLGPVGIMMNASINRDQSIQSRYIGPGMFVLIRGLRASVSWRSYRTTTETYESKTQGTSFSLTIPLRDGFNAMFRGDFQKATKSTSRRLYSGLWIAF